jgi:fatty-acyl-CoA synthase
MNARISYVHGASTTPLLGDTVGSLLDRMAVQFPDRPALVVPGQNVRLDYAGLLAEVELIAAGLLALGLEPGERIGIWAPNCAEWVLLQFATAKAGFILVNINPAYRSHELEYTLNKVGCRALVLARAFKTSNYLQILGELAPELAQATPGMLQAARVPALREVIVLDQAGPAQPGHAAGRNSPAAPTPPRCANCVTSSAGCRSTTR